MPSETFVRSATPLTEDEILDIAMKGREHSEASLDHNHGASVGYFIKRDKSGKEWHYYIAGVNHRVGPNRRSTHSPEDVIVNAVTLLKDRIKYSEMYTVASEGTQPCGLCRQVLLDYAGPNAESKVYTLDRKLVSRETFEGGLLRRPFGEKHLGLSTSVESDSDEDEEILSEMPGDLALPSVSASSHVVSIASFHRPPRLQTWQILDETGDLEPAKIKAYFRTMRPHIISEAFKTTPYIRCILQCKRGGETIGYALGVLVQNVAFLTTEVISAAMANAITQFGSKDLRFAEIHLSTSDNDLTHAYLSQIDMDLVCNTSLPSSSGSYVYNSTPVHFYTADNQHGIYSFEQIKLAARDLQDKKLIETERQDQEQDQGEDEESSSIKALIRLDKPLSESEVLDMVVNGREHSDAPLSNYHVAAVGHYIEEDESGQEWHYYSIGVNHEVDPNRGSTHAEQNMIALAVASLKGDKKFSEVYIVAAPRDAVPDPTQEAAKSCGHCRQVMLGFDMPDAEIKAFTLALRPASPDSYNRDFLKGAVRKKNSYTVLASSVEAVRKTPSLEESMPESSRTLPISANEQYSDLQAWQIFEETGDLEPEKMEAYLRTMRPHIIDEDFKTTSYTSCILKCKRRDKTIGYAIGVLVQNDASLSTEPISAAMANAMTQFGSKDLRFAEIHLSTSDNDLTHAQLSQMDISLLCNASLPSSRGSYVYNSTPVHFYTADNQHGIYSFEQIKLAARDRQDEIVTETEKLDQDQRDSLMRRAM